MLRLEDFAYLPQAKALIDQMVDAGPGIVIVTGLDPRPHTTRAGGSPFLPSGRAAVFRLLMRQMLQRRPADQAVIVTSAEPPHLPRALRRRIETLVVDPSSEYAAAIGRAAGRRPDLLVVDHLTPGSASAAFEAARSGTRVLTQRDTPLRGAAVLRQLLDLGLAEALLPGPTWLLSLQRLLTLCPACKEPALLTDQDLAALYHLQPGHQSLLQEASIFSAAGCDRCEHTGRSGEVTALDIYQASPDTADPLSQPSQLPLEAYMLALVARGQLALEDVRRFDARQLQLACGLLAAAERAQQDAERQTRQAMAELSASRTVLQQKTEALISLEGIGQALILSADLQDLAARLCHYAQRLCAADRAILYYVQPESGTAEILACSGWDPGLVGRAVPESLLAEASQDAQPSPWDGPPPGLSRSPTDLMAETLRAGLRVPLVAQAERVGLMVVHTSQRAGFAPGEIALLQAFANQAAVAIQRSALTDALQAKVIALEEAQVQLVQKERMERELELARQVQQSVLPRVFPLAPGYAFAARSLPARWVGGDFYDVILLDGDHLGLLIGDVSDKGMAAALYMAQTHSLIRAEAQRQEPGAPGLPASPERVLRSVHSLLQGLSRTEMFVTVFYGVLDIPGRRLVYARAGHDPPLLLRQGQATSLGGQGTLLGFPDLHDLHLAREEVGLQSGDRLILYTDGMIDATDPKGRHYGRGRFKAAICGASALSASELCEASFASLESHQAGADLYDDATLLVVEIR